MDNSTSEPGRPDHDQSLLEGLFQLAISGQSGGHDFAQIEREVYARLQDTYQSPTTAS